jgi:hypothetical protein
MSTTVENTQTNTESNMDSKKTELEKCMISKEEFEEAAKENGEPSSSSTMSITFLPNGELLVIPEITYKEGLSEKEKEEQLQYHMDSAALVADHMKQINGDGWYK